MPQSYSSIWLHLIWSTKNREPILVPGLKQEVFQVINTTAKDHEIYLDCINGVEDHIHLLVRLRTDQSVADIVKTIKGNSWEFLKAILKNTLVGKMALQYLVSVLIN
ncbi:transposase [Mucilaginibacter antarcticus]|uniref:transposase n=1 Tax=Mucilaginibacter antarcticus TaxID=1855725 RepID=UPI003627D9E5